MRLNNYLKIVTIFLLLCFSATYLAVHTSGGLYPELLVGTFAGSLALVGYVLYVGRSVNATLVLIVLVSVTYRTVTFLHPESLISVDPDAYARWAQLLIDGGSIEAMGLGFYDAAPIFLLNISIFSAVLDVSTPDGMVMYPILTGILFPLTAAAVAKYLPDSSPRIVLLSALFVAVATTSMTFSYRPKAQIHATLFLCVLVILLLRPAHTNRLELVGLTLVFITALAYTHKLLPFFVVLALFPILLYTVVFRRYFDLSGSVVTYSLFLFAGMITMFQWLFQTSLISTVVFRLQQLMRRTGSPTAVTQPAAAEVAIPGTIPHLLPFEFPPQSVLFVERFYMAILLLLGGLAWLSLARKRYDDQRSVAILSIIAVGVAMAIVGTVSIRGLNPSRGLLLVEFILVPVVVWACYQSYIGFTGEVKKYAGMVVLVLLLGTFIFSPASIPEYENNPQYYLNTGEVDAKLFGCEYVDETIHTDFYYSQESYLRSTDCLNYASLDRGTNTPLYQGTVIDQEYRYIAHRKNVDVYAGRHSRYSLIWNPSEEYDNNYIKMFDSQEVAIYNNQ